jgi:tetratricopeptide (TPR) repeat protein
MNRMNNYSPAILEDQARRAYQNADYSGAVSLYEQAQNAYATAGDELKAAEMANDRAVALLQENRPEYAYQASLGTEKVFEKAGDNLRYGMAIGNQATALEELGRFEEALSFYRKSASLFETEDENEYRAHVLKRISALHFKQGRKLEAIAAMEAALALKTKPTISERITKGLFGVLSRMLNPGKDAGRQD